MDTNKVLSSSVRNDISRRPTIERRALSPLRSNSNNSNINIRRMEYDPRFYENLNDERYGNTNAPTDNDDDDDADAAATAAANYDNNDNGNDKMFLYEEDNDDDEYEEYEVINVLGDIIDNTVVEKIAAYPPLPNQDTSSSSDNLLLPIDDDPQSPPPPLREEKQPSSTTLPPLRNKNNNNEWNDPSYRSRQRETRAKRPRDQWDSTTTSRRNDATFTKRRSSGIMSWLDELLEEDDDDDDNEDDDYDPRSSTKSWFKERGRRTISDGGNDKRQSRLRQRPQSLNVPARMVRAVDNLFGIDTEVLAARSKEYDRTIGIGSYDLDRETKRRRGYAYRLRDDDYDDDFSTTSNNKRSRKGSSSSRRVRNDVGKDGDNVDDVQVQDDSITEVMDGINNTTTPDDLSNFSSTTNTNTNNSTTSNSIVITPSSKTWKERAEASEQVPPGGVEAWGPDGSGSSSIIFGKDDEQRQQEKEKVVDALTLAATKAKDEIQNAEEDLELRKVRVRDTEDQLVKLKM